MQTENDTPIEADLRLEPLSTADMRLVRRFRTLKGGLPKIHVYEAKSKAASARLTADEAAILAISRSTKNLYSKIDSIVPVKIVVLDVREQTDEDIAVQSSVESRLTKIYAIQRETDEMLTNTERLHEENAELKKAILEKVLDTHPDKEALKIKLGL